MCLKTTVVIYEKYEKVWQCFFFPRVFKKKTHRVQFLQLLKRSKSSDNSFLLYIFCKMGFDEIAEMLHTMNTTF